MRASKPTEVLFVALVLSCAVSTVHCAPPGATPHFLVEAYPAPVKASKQIYRRSVSAAGIGVSYVPKFIIVPTVQRWKIGQLIRVAFKGGDARLYRRIAAAASTWMTTGGANLSFSFTDASGNYRVWSPADVDHSAEIRIAFESGPMGGYWSHVGTDSVNEGLVGGGPGQASMNLDSFDRSPPPDWEAIVIHEFGHALGFEHEHQSPSEGCDFRFDDDPGYVPTKDALGWYTADVNGRRPGLYTYLGGYANYWPREQVDQNLRSLPASSAFLVGPFDKNSVMKYFFNAFMFIANDQSPCYTPTENLTVSAQDAIGVQKAYPKNAADAELLRTQKRMTLEQLRVYPDASAELLRHVTRQLNGL